MGNNENTSLTRSWQLQGLNLRLDSREKLARNPPGSAHHTRCSLRNFDGLDPLQSSHVQSDPARREIKPTQAHVLPLYCLDPVKRERDSHRIARENQGLFSEPEIPHVV